MGQTVLMGNSDRKRGGYDMDDRIKNINYLQTNSELLRAFQNNAIVYTAFHLDLPLSDVLNRCIVVLADNLEKAQALNTEYIMRYGTIKKGRGGYE